MEGIKRTTELDTGCLQCLRYFGIFKYPLTAEEVHRFNLAPSDFELVKSALENLVKNGTINRIERFYLHENKKEWIEERNKGNQRAYKVLAKSGKYVSIIARFPFVRGIAISGSLSKFYASEKTDIDYFIITDSNRLWIARTLLHVFKKLTFITGHQHYFCMNYFVDTDALEITHQNQYSAIEVATVLSVYNSPLIDKFRIKNDWISKFLPNNESTNNYEYVIPDRKHPGKRFIEKLINFCFPDRLNKRLMNLTDKKWRRKWKRKGFDFTNYDRAFQTEINISKTHHFDYEKKVMDTLSNPIQK